MTQQTEQEELIISKLMNLLQEKHNKEPTEKYCHYVVKGENEEECDSEDYCEKCIDKAVREFRDKHSKKRAQKLLQLKDLKEKGYCINRVWNDQYNCMSLGIFISNDVDLINQDIALTEKKYPKNEEFSYRYYQLDSRDSFELCENCGIFIECCITIGGQEMERWEDLSDSDYTISEMSEHVAYEIFEWLRFLHQADQDIYDRGVALVERILKINESPII